MGLFSFVKPGKKIFDTITSVGPKVNKTKKEKLTSKLKILQQKTKASGAKLDQTRFELKNKMPLTFGKSSKKTMSNTERAQKAALRKEDKKQETKTKHFYAPENFNKGGRVGLKFGSKKKSNVQKIQETFGPKKQLSAKQMKIAKLAGDPKKIDAQDLAKLRGRG